MQIKKKEEEEENMQVIQKEFKTKMTKKRTRKIQLCFT